jgi:glutamyl-tRNA synthetase
MKTNQKVRVRFAPSPTGEVHIGSARTALFDYLFAKHNDGKIILRIEDTDQKRFVQGAVERLVASMKWLGIEFDESPEKGGKYAPYTQSERLGIYQEYAQKLIEDGHAYYCFCSEDRLTKMREEQVKNKQAPMYDKTCQCLHGDEIKKKLDSGEKYVIRLKVPEGGKTVFTDLIRGYIEFDNVTIDDQVLIKSDGMPTYHLANVVDDHLMNITHVFRAEEWLPSTPKHIILYNAFNWNIPEFGHISLVLAPDKTKLSKRHGATSVEEFRKLGYLPEALINYISLLGWNPKSDREFFTIDELIKEFDIKNINKSGAVFDIEKLNHFNSHYIKNLSNEELINKLNLQITDKYRCTDNMDKIISVIKDRMVKLSDFEELIKPFTSEIKYDAELLVFKKSTKDLTIKGLQATSYKLQATSKWELIDELNRSLLSVVSDNSLTNGDVFWPVRVALSGLEKSPSPTQMLWVLGKDESIKRIEKAIKNLSK